MSLRKLVGALALAAPLSLLPAQTTLNNVVYATVSVAGQPFDLRLNLAVPAGAGPFPVVVWIHGGGWSGGSHSPIPNAVTRMLPRGYAAASIAYRLTGQSPWPAQIQDCKAAIRFLRANAASYGLDPDRIAVMGSSAGGHLTAALATMGDVGDVRSGSYAVDLEGTVGAHVGVSSRVQCAVDLYGPTAMLLANDFPTFDHDGPSSPESALVGGPLQDNPEKWATVDPISFVSPDDPPMLMLHGTLDTSVPFVMSDRLLRAATAIGNDARLFPVVGEGHGGPLFGSAESTAAIDGWLDAHLRDLPDVTVSVVATDAAGSEAGDPATFTVSRTGSLAAPLSVRLWLAGDVAPGADCERLPLRCTIPAGQAATTVALVPLQDDLVEGDETARLHVAPSRAYRVAHAAQSAVAVIADDDVGAGLPVVSLVPLDAFADEAGGNPGAVRFVRTGATTAPLTVAYELAGSAIVGEDCAPLSGSLTFPAGSASRLVVVVPVQDTAREPAETVVLRLLASADYQRGANRTGHVVIRDDDRSSPLPVVGVLATGNEPAENGADGTFQLTRTGSTAAPLTVALQVGGSAAPSADYVALPTSVTFPAGSAVVDVPVSVLDDAALEGAERIDCAIVPQAAYVVGAGAHAKLWIADDEVPTAVAAPVATLDVGPLRVGDEGSATVLGGSSFGVAALWIATEPGYVPFAPFGTVQLGPAFTGSYLTALLDGNGDATFAVPIPSITTLQGLPFWWQAIVTTPTSPFLTLSNGVRRELLGSPPF